MRLLGHPVHPMVVAFPLALLSVATAADVLAWAGAWPAMSRIGYGCELTGLAGAVIAALTGVPDLIKLAPGSAPQGTAIWHALAAISTASLYGVAFALRGGPSAQGISATALVLELVGAAVLTVTGWLGGHLVFHHRVGVHAADEPRGSP